MERINNLIAEINEFGYGVVIKQIITREYSLFDIRHKKDGDEIVTNPNGRQFVKRKNKPIAHNGEFLIDICNDNSSQMQISPYAVYDISIEGGLSKLLAKLKNIMV